MSLFLFGDVSFTIFLILEGKKYANLFSCIFIMISLKLTNSKHVLLTVTSLHHLDSHWLILSSTEYMSFGMNLSSRHIFFFSNVLLLLQLNTYWSKPLVK